MDNLGEDDSGECEVLIGVFKEPFEEAEEGVFGREVEGVFERIRLLVC